MDSKTLIRGTLVAGLVGVLGGVGCSIAASEDTGSSPDHVVASTDTSLLLKSTLVLQGGCIAAKVGPRHLLVSARCVTDNAAFAAGKALTFVSAASGQVLAQEAPAPKGAGSNEGDAGAASPNTAPATASNPSARDATIASIEIHASYASKCKPTAADSDVCGFDKLDASDAADIALIILSSELATIPSIPIDLDPVGQADPVLVVTAGCPSVDGVAASAPKTVRTIAVPAKSVNHAGSPYESSPQLVTRLAASYVVTAGAGWRPSEPRFCATDIGAPLFRANAVAVAGVTANYTTFADANLPVTTHHTRVDTMSQFKIGAWLAGLGALTIHSCSEASGGCVKHSYDGGTPSGDSTGTTGPGDGGGTVIAPDASADDGGTTDNSPHSDQLPSEDPATSDPSTGDDYADAAVPKKQKAAAKSGCSAAPGSPAPTGELLLGFGLALGAVVLRRRRAC